MSVNNIYPAMIFAALFAGPFGYVIGLSQAREIRDDSWRYLIARADLPEICEKKLRETREELREEDELRHEIMKDRTR